MMGDFDMSAIYKIYIFLTNHILNLAIKSYKCACLFFKTGLLGSLLLLRSICITKRHLNTEGCYLHSFTLCRKNIYCNCTVLIPHLVPERIYTRYFLHEAALHLISAWDIFTSPCLKLPKLSQIFDLLAIINQINY